MPKLNLIPRRSTAQSENLIDKKELKGYLFEYLKEFERKFNRFDRDLKGGSTDLKEVRMRFKRFESYYKY